MRRESTEGEAIQAHADVSQVLHPQRNKPFQTQAGTSQTATQVSSTGLQRFSENKIGELWTQVSGLRSQEKAIQDTTTF